MGIGSRREDSEYTVTYKWRRQGEYADIGCGGWQWPVRLGIWCGRHWRWLKSHSTQFNQGMCIPNVLCRTQMFIQTLARKWLQLIISLMNAKAEKTMFKTKKGTHDRIGYMCNILTFDWTVYISVSQMMGPLLSSCKTKSCNCIHE